MNVDTHTHTHTMHIGIIPDGNRRWCRAHGVGSRELVEHHGTTVVDALLRFEELRREHSELGEIRELSMYMLSHDNLTKRGDDSLEMVFSVLRIMHAASAVAVAALKCDVVDLEADEEGRHGAGRRAHSDGTTVWSCGGGGSTRILLGLETSKASRPAEASASSLSDEPSLPCRLPDVGVSPVVTLAVDVDALLAVLLPIHRGLSAPPSAEHLSAVIGHIAGGRVRVRIAQDVVDRLPPPWDVLARELESASSVGCGDGDPFPIAAIDIVSLPERGDDDAPSFHAIATVPTPELADEVRRGMRRVGTGFDDVAVRFIGELTALPPLAAAMCQDIQLLLAGGSEIVREVDAGPRRRVVCLNLAIAYDPVEDMRRNLSAPDDPDGPRPMSPIDLVIRTSGEQRSSGFFPVQTLYSEWIYLPMMFPDFKVEDLVGAIRQFRSRSRRWGA